VFLIEAGARRLEGFYREHGANDGVIGGIRGARLVLMNEFHAELIKAARHLDERRDNLYRGGLMPFLVGQAQALYEKRREYLD
jgi:hypothetical protein